MTAPVETFSIGQSIVISRGLINVLSDEASLDMVLSDELAHIALGHRTETMFEDSQVLQRLRLGRSEHEIEEPAGKRSRCS